MPNRKVDRTWAPDPTSRRRTPRPVGWKTLRQRVLDRDGSRCTWVEGLLDGGHWTMADHPDRCPAVATEVDHIGADDDHHPDQLRSLCGPHHRHRTGMQAAAARHQRRPQPRAERHPGLID